MNDERFPVVDERPLPPPEHRWLWRPWRNPALLPALPPGCILVLVTDGRYVVHPDPSRLRGTEPDFVRATWMSIVSIRYRRIVATTWVPTTDPADDFLVRAVFGCTVVQPEAVAHSGLTDLQGDLDIRLRLDEHLMGLQHQFGTDQIADIRAAVTRDLGNAYKQRPPTVAGMDIRFEGVHVCPPRALREQHAELRDVLWSWRTEALRAEIETRRVNHVEELLRTPERAEAAAIAREERATKDAADRAFKERETRTQQLIDHVTEWMKTDSVKRAPVDRRYFADALFEQLTGKPAPVVVTPRTVQSNGSSEPPKDGPRIPPPNLVDGM